MVRAEDATPLSVSSRIQVLWENTPRPRLYSIPALPRNQFCKSDVLPQDEGPIDPKTAWCYQIVMYKTGIGILLFWLLATQSPAQQEPAAQTTDESAYGSKFFDQLRNIFGQFRDSDLQRVFQDAKPIQCSELVGRKGEWRPVAFFNEDRKLGDWCRESLEEVKADLAVYTFKGTCSGDQGTVQVASEFPTAAAMEAYNQGQIELDQVDVTANDPVNAVFNTRNMAYTFELPYLFLTDRHGMTNVYSLVAPNRDSAYATDVTSRWECKAVASKDVTYRFLICRVATVPRGSAARRQSREPSFGGSAFFILSDGTEAQTSVNLSFGDGSHPAETSPDAPKPASSPARPELKRPSKPKP